MKALVTGGAGFIGSHLVDRLLQAGHYVRVSDDFSTGQRRFLVGAPTSDRFELNEGDLFDERQIETAMHDVDFVWHLAANADVRFGIDQHVGILNRTHSRRQTYWKRCEKTEFVASHFHPRDRSMVRPVSSPRRKTARCRYRPHCMGHPSWLVKG